MAFNRKAHFQTNIEAIRIAFILDKAKRKATEAEREVLRQYCGFGGIKCILNPVQTEMDKAYWTQTDMPLFGMVADLHQLIRDNSKNELEYKRYYGNLRNSVLTAFYTPPEIIHAISETLRKNGVKMHLSSLSGIKISALIAENVVEHAISALHAKFLDEGVLSPQAS